MTKAELLTLLTVERFQPIPGGGPPAPISAERAAMNRRRLAREITPENRRTEHDNH